MNQQLEIKKRLLPTMVMMGIIFWMITVIFLYLLLFGPPEFWSISERLGFSHLFQICRDWLQPFFIAGYLE